jgi:hypothetical protein
MADLDMLANILRSGAQGKADLAGLDEDFARANAMRDNKGPQANQYGTVSPMSVMANVINQSRGRKQARELTPQRAAARQQVAESANAFPMYQADVAAKKATQDQLNTENKASALTQAAKLANTNKVNAAELAESEVVELVSNADSSDVMPVREYAGKYYDQFTGEQVSGVGRSVRAKTGRGGGSKSRFQLSKSTDAYGNVVKTSYDKWSDSESAPTFVDGTPYSPEEAKRRGGVQAGQAGDVTTAKETGKANVKASENAYEETFAIRGAMQEMDKGLDALINGGANTGFFADKMPNVRASAVKLQAAKDQMALYEIGKYTFGSLSEAEGRWLKDVVIPTSLDEDELIPWMERKREGMSRMLKVKEFEQKMRDNGHKPTQQEVDAILHSGGFSFSDG